VSSAIRIHNFLQFAVDTQGVRSTKQHEAVNKALLVRFRVFLVDRSCQVEAEHEVHITTLLPSRIVELIIKTLTPSLRSRYLRGIGHGVGQSHQNQH
jgi:hypothetical protein